MTLWLAVALAGAGTFAIRLSMIAFVRHDALPAGARDALRFVMPAALGAIIAPAVLYAGGSLDATAGNERLVAALLAAAVARLTGNVWLTIAGGMGLLWLLQWAA